MKCCKCDAVNQEDANFCCKCGNSLVDQLPDKNEKTIKSEILPFLQKIPGYRSKTPWKMLLATIIYGFILVQIVSPKEVAVSNDSKAVISYYDQVEALRKNKDFEKAKSIYSEMALKFPNAAETAKAKRLIDDIPKLEQQEKEAKEKEAQIKAEEDQKRAVAASARKARLESVLSNMRTKTDEVQNITWYYDKSTSNYTNENDFYMYIGEKNNNPWLRFRIQFTASDWLFIKRYIIKADDRTFTIEPKYGEVQRDNRSNIWEWYDTNLDKQKYDIVKAVISSNKAILRCEGDKYYKDRTITGEEKQALQNILDTYEALGGSLNF